MSVFTDISVALDSRLNTLADSPPVAWENKKYTPTKGTLYLRPANLAGAVEPSTLGDNGQDMNEGVYQVDVFAPGGKGKKAANDAADNVADHFKRGTDLTYNGRTVRIKSVSRNPGRNSNGWYQIPVIINYYAITSART
jgi:hypothetical protein